MNIIIKPDWQEAAETARNTKGIVVATCTSERNGYVGIGLAILDTTSVKVGADTSTATYRATLGPRDQQNPYTAELAATAVAVEALQFHQHICNIVITTIRSNQAALLAISHPQQQSGQSSVVRIYGAARELREKGNVICGTWVPAQEGIELKSKAKTAARQVTERGGVVQSQTPSTISTTLNLAKVRQKQARTLPKGVGNTQRNWTPRCLAGIPALSTTV
jgi:hypothetical protein